MATIPESPGAASALRAKALHDMAIRCHDEGDYKQALDLIEGALKCEETSSRWNDYGVMQLRVKNTSAAESGFRRALQLDAGNRLAAANIVVLLENLGREEEAGSFLEAASAEALQMNRDAALLAVAQTGNRQFLANELRKCVSRLPRQDPQLPSSLREALDRCRNSEFLARQCCALLARMPSHCRCVFLDAFRMLAAWDSGYQPIVGLWQMKENDYAGALVFFRKAFDSNPADLFAESMIIACEHMLFEVGVSSNDPFEGIENYLEGRFCENPWKHLEFAADKGAYLCCPAWLPMCIGTPSAGSAENVWHSVVAAKVRQSVMDGSFKYCSKIHCPSIAARRLPSRSSAREHVPELKPVLDAECGSNAIAEAVPAMPSKLVLSYDRTCNLACLQCRSSFYSATRAEHNRMGETFEGLILTAARSANVLNLNGSGEVFASRHSRRILSLLKRDQYPNLKLSIISNGQLFDRRAFEAFDLKQRLLQVDISIDAARAETYRVVRRGGDFNRLLRNLQFLDDLRAKEGEAFHIILRFVVSVMNFREMPEFVTFARRFHANSILFTVIRNWGTYTEAAFERINIVSPSNPLHGEFVNILNSSELLDPTVHLGSLGTYRLNGKQRPPDATCLPGCPEALSPTSTDKCGATSSACESFR